MCLSSTYSEPRSKSLPLSVLSFFSTNAQGRDRWLGGHIPLTLWCHAGHSVGFGDLAIANAVGAPGQEWSSNTSKFLWGETPTEKTWLIQTWRVTRGGKGLVSVANKVLASRCLTLREFQDFPPNPAKLLLSANVFLRRWRCRTGLCFLLSIWWWLLVFGSCEIQMPSSRRIFPLLGTSGHPLSLTLSSLRFCLESISFAYEFAEQIIQLIYSCALIQG